MLEGENWMKETSTETGRKIYYISKEFSKVKFETTQLQHLYFYYQDQIF